MEKLIEALKALLGHANRDEVVTAMEKEAPAVYQAVFQKGHDIGYGKKHGELEKATARVTTLEGELTTANAELTKLKNSPDTKALHDQYGAQIGDLQTKAKAREAELLTTLRTERHNQRLAALRGHLVTPGADGKHLAADYADVLLQKADNAGRIKINDDGTWQVLQKGKDIPIAAQTPEAALQLMAGELIGEAPASFVLVGTDTGGGIGGSKGTPAPAGAAALAASIRDSVSKAAKPEGPKHHGAFAGLSSPAQ